MTGRLPSWVLLLYMAIDLANPFIPGAFRFTPEGGLVWVEGVPQARNVRSHDGQGAVMAVFGRSDAADANGPAVTAQPAVQARGMAWPARVRTVAPPAREGPNEDDDH
jgi:hypothetical protein